MTGFNWNSNGTNDIYVPRTIDGYTVTEIGAYAFSSEDKTISTNKTVGTSSVVILPDTITVLGEKAFFCSNITSISLPSSIQYIDSGALAGCININQFVIDSKNAVYATIDGALYNKTKKELVAVPFGKYDGSLIFTIPNGIVSIGPYAFYGINFATKESFDGPCVSFPDSLVSIESYAFAHTKLYSTKKTYTLLPFPFNNVKTIGDHAFYRCDAHFIFDWGIVETIGDYAFSDFTKKMSDFTDNDLILPATLTYIGKGAFSNFKGARSQDGGFSVLDLSKTKLKEIPDEAFADFKLDSYITSGNMGPRKREIKLPTTLEHIGKNAFQYISLDNRSTFRPAYLTLPSNLKTIDEYAFDSAGLYLDFSSATKLETISDYAFHSACFFMDNETLVLPENVKEIGKEAFNGQNLHAIQFPDSTTKIGSDVCNRSKTIIIANPGTFAALYASENGFPFEAIGGDDTSWLND